MKIAFLSEVYHPTINGVVISIDTFAKELKKLGHKVVIFAPDNHKHIQDPSNVYRIKSQMIPFNKDYFLTEPSPKNIYQLKKLDVDIIHTQHMFKMGWFGYRAGAQLNIPVVHTYHTLIAEYSQHVPFLGSVFPFKQIIKKTLINQSVKYCNAVDTLVTPSKPMAKVLNSYGINRSIEVVSTGINLSDFNQEYGEIAQQHNIGKKTKIILFVGRISFEKNIGLLIDSFKEIVKKCVDVKLILVGSGPQIDFYQKLVKEYKLNDKVIFTGFVDPKITKKYFLLADIFAFPSVTDTQGIVIAEAMAAKTAVVAVNRLGPTDVIVNEVNGLLTEPTIKSFSRAIIRVLNNPLYAKRLINNSQDTVKKYTTNYQTNKLISVYKSTIDEYRHHKG